MLFCFQQVRRLEKRQAEMQKSYDAQISSLTARLAEETESRKILEAEVRSLTRLVK